LEDLDFTRSEVVDQEERDETLTAALEEEDAAEDDGGALDFELELDELDTETAESTRTARVSDDAAGAGDQLGGDLGMDFDPEAEDMEAEAEEDDRGIEYHTSEIERAADEAETASGFAETEELTIDADLEQAAVSISEEAAEVAAGADAIGDLEVEGDLAVEAIADTEEDPLAELELEAAVQSDDEFEFEDQGDSANTKLDLARAYIDMGDADGARDILKEVLDEGNSDQQQKAQAMLEAL
jgi:pilus assembly protein FimV